MTVYVLYVSAVYRRLLNENSLNGCIHVHVYSFNIHVCPYMYIVLWYGAGNLVLH